MCWEIFSSGYWHKIMSSIFFLGTVKYLILLSDCFYWWCLYRPVNIPQVWFLACCSLYWGTLGWLLMGWVYLIYLSWIGKCPGKSLCLVLLILSINFLNFWYGIMLQPHHMISLIAHMNRSISPIWSFAKHVCRCASDKVIGCVEIHFCHGNQW